MRKTHKTFRELDRLNKPIYWVRYDVGRFLEKRYTPIYYNAGMYGWNYDVYEINGILFIYGDRPRQTYPHANLNKFMQLTANIEYHIIGGYVEEEERENHLYYYDIRHNPHGEDTVERYVRVNHIGTIIVNYPMMDKGENIVPYDEFISRVAR